MNSKYLRNSKYLTKALAFYRIVYVELIKIIRTQTNRMYSYFFPQ